MTGRVLGWLLVCDPVEQTAAQLAEALEASAGSISGATGMLVRAGLVDRMHIRGERADRFRLRPEAWDEQVRDQGIAEARALLAQGLEALAGDSGGPPGTAGGARRASTHGGNRGCPLCGRNGRTTKRPIWEAARD